MRDRGRAGGLPGAFEFVGVAAAEGLRSDGCW